MYTIYLFLVLSHRAPMRPYALLVVVAPLVLAAPTPNPAPVAALRPVPAALPNSQGQVTNPITGLVTGLIDGVVNAGSLIAAVPAIISDLGNLLDATETVTGKLPCHLLSIYQNELMGV